MTTTELLLQRMPGERLVQEYEIACEFYVSVTAQVANMEGKQTAEFGWRRMLDMVIPLWAEQFKSRDRASAIRNEMMVRMAMSTLDDDLLTLT